MSYDLMVFNKETAPKNEEAFMEWYQEETEWTEDHSYDDPANTSENLKAWFMEIKDTYPAMNGPYSSDDEDDPKVTDYCIGNNVIYAAFAWSQAEQAYPSMFNIAAKHNVGFFDASGESGIFIPDGKGNLKNIREQNKSVNPWWKFW